MNNLILNGDFRTGTVDVKVGNGAGTVPTSTASIGAWSLDVDETDAATNKHVRIRNLLLASAVAAGKITQPDDTVIGDSVLLLDIANGSLGTTRTGFGEVVQLVASAPLALSEEMTGFNVFIYSKVAGVFNVTVSSNVTYAGGSIAIPFLNETVQLEAGWNRIRRVRQHPFVYETHPTLGAYVSSNTEVIFIFDGPAFSSVNINQNTTLAITGAFLGLAVPGSEFDRIEEILRTSAVAQAAAGVVNGVATGGSVGQVYKKNSSTDFDASFANVLGGPTAAGATTGTINLDLTSGSEIQTVVLTGAPTFNTANRAAGKFLSIKIDSNGADRALSFNASWKWLGTDNSAGVTLASGKIAVLSLTCYGTAETDIVAVYSAQP